MYIGLDEQSRTKGKAAIDVAGAQTGKSIGSVLQQVGSLLVSLPALVYSVSACCCYRCDEVRCKLSQRCGPEESACAGDIILNIFCPFTFTG